MDQDTYQKIVTKLMKFARKWNRLYAEGEFEKMKKLARKDVAIANAADSKSITGLVYGREAYYNGIIQAYQGTSGNEKNLLVMDYENWEYIPLGDKNLFYTIGKYTLEPNIVGVNCWLMKRKSSLHRWKIYRVINN